MSSAVLDDSQGELCNTCIKFMQLNSSDEKQLDDIVFCEFVDVISQIALIIWDHDRYYLQLNNVLYLFNTI